MNVAAVMDEIATELDTIADLRVFAYPPDSIPAPAAIIGYPETITYDVSMSRGVDQLDFPVYVMVGRLTDRNSRDKLSPFISGSGASSIKAVILAGKPWVAMSSVRVASCEVDVITMGGVDYLTAIFTVNVFGSGD